MAAKQYIIDAHNVMHKLPEVERLMAQGITTARTRFMGILGDYAVSHRACRFTVVFDGTAKDVKYSSPNVSILRSGAVKSADELIFDLIRKTRSGGATVVSSDNEISNFARASALDTMPSAEFADMISCDSAPTRSDAEKPTHTRLRDFEELRRLFEGAPIGQEPPYTTKDAPKRVAERPKRPPKEKITDMEMLKMLKGKDFAEKQPDSDSEREKPAFASRPEIDEFLRLFSESE